MKSLNCLRKEIKEKYDGIPEKQVSLGVYVHTYGRKYIHLLNTHETSTITKIPIEEFYEEYM